MDCFVNWIHTPDGGYRPDLPEGTGFLMLAEPGAASAGAKFALFECDLEEGSPAARKVVPVTERLRDALDSARAYPPALALARNEVEKGKYRRKREFAEALTILLSSYLAAQRTAPCFLAVARTTEAGYKTKGGYYWIVGRRGENVAWVSRDFFVYHNPIDDFDINLDELKRRFGDAIL